MNQKLDLSRHTEIFNPSEFNPERIDIIGAGALGAEIVLQLAKLGIENLHVWDFGDSEISVSLTPHFGTEYWLSEKFSVSGEAGITFGLGEVYQNENRVGTTSSIHVNYYFMSSSD